MPSRNFATARAPAPRIHRLTWAAASALALAASPPTLAATKTLDCASTNWTSSTCWNADGVPVAGDIVNVTPVGAGSTTLSITSGTTAAAATLSVDSTTGVLAQVSQSGGTLSLSSSYMVGVSGTGVGIQSGGTLTAASLQLGPYAGSSGSYTFSGASSAMNLSQLYVGVRGNGSLLFGSGTATLSSQFIVGYFDTATSASVVQNGGTLTAPSSYIGVDGRGSFEQAAGTHSVDGTLYLGYGPAGSGTYTLKGGNVSTINTYVGRAGSGSVLQTNGSFTTGTLALGQLSGSSGSYTLNGGTLTLDHITPGSGSSGFYWNGGQLNHQGTLTIASGGSIGAALSLSSLKALNTPWLMVEGSGTVSVNGGSVTAPQVSNDGHINVNAGTVQTDTRFNNNGVLILGGGTVTGTGQFVNMGTVGGKGSLEMNGQFSNSGLLRPEDGTLYVQGQAGISSTGTVDLQAGARLSMAGSGWSNAGLVQMNGGSLIGATLTNTATGLLSGRGVIEAALVNQGQITVSGGSLVLGSTLTNSGIVQLGGLGTQLAGSGMLTNTGTVQGAGNVGMRVANSGTLEAVGGTLSFSALANTNAASGVLLAGSGGKLLMTQGLATNAGLIQLEGGSFDNGGVAMANTGRIVGQGSLRAGTLSNSNQIAFSFGTSSIAAPISNQASAKLIISNGAQVTFAAAVSNAGELRTSAGGAANFFGLVSGGGSFTGSGQTRFEGGFSPGFSPAVVTVDPQVFIGSSSTVTMELGGNTPGACDACHDKVVFNGLVTLEGGPLAVVWWNGYQGHAGDRFDLFDWNGGLSGRFGSLLLPTLGGGLVWQTDALYTEGVLGVAAVPEPGAWALMLLGGAGLLAWRRRATARQVQTAAEAASG